MANAAKHLYEFGPFHIDAGERVLYYGEKMIPLTPKAIDTLLVLVARSEAETAGGPMMEAQSWPAGTKRCLDDSSRIVVAQLIIVLCVLCVWA